MKDDIKYDIKQRFKEYEQINFDQNEIIKNKQDQLCETMQWKTSRWKNIHRDYSA